MAISEATTYVPDNIKTAEAVIGGQVLELPVTLNKESFILKGLNIGTDKKPVTIFIFNPRDNELADAAAKDLANLIPPDSFVVTPFSDKSVPMVQLAASWADQLAQENYEPHNSTVSVFPRGTSIPEMNMHAAQAYAFTKSIKAGEDRFLGVNYSQGEAIIKAFNEGKIITVADDVRSTGSTETAMIAVLLMVIGDKALKPEFRNKYPEIMHQIEVSKKSRKQMDINPLWLTDQFKFVYVFEEYPFINGQGIPPLPAHVQAVGRIPAIIGTIN